MTDTEQEGDGFQMLAERHAPLSKYDAPTLAAAISHFTCSRSGHHPILVLKYSVYCSQAILFSE